MFPLLANIVSKLNKFNELNLIHKIIIINGIYESAIFFSTTSCKCN